MTARIGFLFNHDQAHQVAHSLPIALAVARARPDVEVLLAVTHPRIAAEAARLVGDGAPANLSTVTLAPTSALARGAQAMLGAAVPVAKLMLYREHLAFFTDLDLLVVAEKTSLLLKTRYGLAKPRIVHTRHGAGDRAVGFDRASATFDRVLVSGPKIAERLAAQAGVDPARISMVGYPKFDVARRALPLRLFADDRPTVLYNPHGSPRLSSWYRMGRRVLDLFAASERYNLIFAPHVMLFARPAVVSIAPPGLALPGRVARLHREASNIHVDLGSPASLDMSYTEAADIYLGDVSSQVYEFLRRPRPCVFLNAHGADPAAADNLHWRAGPVVDDVTRLEAALDVAVARHAAAYAPIQRDLFAHTFDLTDRPSSERAAEAVMAMLGERPGG